MAADNENDGKVGYKRPPNHSKFKPGQSGNPKGSHKPSRTLKADFLEELAEIVCVSDGDRELKITKQRAIVKSLITAAIDGDMRAITALMSFCSRSLGHEQEDDQSSPASDDFDILSDFVGREVRRHAAHAGADDDSQLQSQNRKTTNEN